MADSYSRVYRIGLLDDLHNYVPELLYNIESFHSVQDVLQYIRTRTTRRFNIFDNAMREYTNRSREPFLNPQNVVHRYTDPLAQPTLAQPRQPSLVDPSLAQPRQSFAQADYTSILIPLISSLGEPRVARPRVVYEDVIVHASHEIIDQTSRETTLLVDAEGNCSVCQDQMKKDESVRTLNGCAHTFHKACIDPWLLNRSVLCPTCRHDIREDMPQPPRVSEPAEEDEIDDYDENLPANFINSLFARRHF
jgi:hypothetical protein